MFTNAWFLHFLLQPCGVKSTREVRERDPHNAHGGLQVRQGLLQLLDNYIIYPGGRTMNKLQLVGEDEWK